MAIIVERNLQVLIGTIDLSDHANKVTIEDSKDSVDVTTFGATNKAVTPGLGDAKMTIDFFQDYASNSVFDTLKTFYQATTPGTVTVKNDKTSPTKSWTMTAWLMNFPSVDASVGDASNPSFEFVNAGTAGITYGTS